MSFVRYRVGMPVDGGRCALSYHLGQPECGAGIRLGRRSEIPSIAQKGLRFDPITGFERCFYEVDAGKHRISLAHQHIAAA
ncbi:hypothetical protein D3C73_780150 [compost metagenome]